jgi:peptidoglycan/LPS O-acetylase OafA/YrhL
LDGLRAVAVLAVIAHHTLVPGMQGAATGVDVFFVLSGFLITSLLRGGLKTLPFYGRRALRLYPALAFLLAVYLVAAPMFWPDHDNLRDAALAATYVSNYTVALWGLPKLLEHTWSLAVEEQFYLLWPLMLPLAIRSQRPIAALAGLYVLTTALHFALPPRLGYYTHCSGLILGALVTFLPRGDARSGLVGAALVLASFVQRVVPAHGWDIVMAEVGTAMIVAQRAPSALNAALAWRPFAGLGKISYGVYLWHYPVALIALGHPWPVTAAITLALSLLMGWVSHRYVEEPAKLAWSRLRPRPAAA